ncbi:MAG: biopolymer transporter ExbD [Planctomycetaceae bacterium]|nr:biopolymer transporter ExbD [Planctomycetaceae bacterium]
MKSPEHLKPRVGRLNLTPMIDVVFLLIIFFIVSNNMIQQDQAIAVDLPEAETGILPEEQQARRLTVTVSNEGTVYVGTEVVDLERLRWIMSEARKDWGEEAEFQIRTDRNVHWGVVKPMLRMAAESGISRVAFAVERR